MVNFTIRWLVYSAGFLAALLIVPGIELTHAGRQDLVFIVLLCGLINCVLGPIFKFFTFPFILLTMGLWLWVVNLGMFWLTGYIGKSIGFGFTADGFWPIFWGALIVSIVNLIFGNLLVNDRQKRLTQSDQ